ncbi:MAG TPA: hypothetical protein VK721_15180 [Solirubrobacteraceae bacterium]|nr:hypothetical protein [Solirubrobacteraceae bacterium]
MTRLRKLALAAVAVTVAATLGGCGSSGSGSGGIPNNAVAVVGGTPITKAALRHWTSVQLATNYELDPQTPLPAGVVYEPSNYAPCVARLRASAREASAGVALTSAQLSAALSKGSFNVSRHAAKKAKARTPAPSTAQLERKCAENYQAVERHILNVLIVFQWDIQEAEADGLNPTEAEVRKEFARFSREHYPQPGELQRLLTYTGERYSDDLMRMRMDLIGIRVAARQLAKMGIDPADVTAAQNRAFLAWSHNSIKRSVAKTSCRKGHVVNNCKQYHGPLEPDPRI